LVRRGGLVYINLDLGIMTLVHQALVLLRDGLIEVWHLARGALKLVEEVLSALGHRAFAVFEIVCSVLWGAVTGVAQALFHVAKRIWMNPILSLAAVALTVYSAFQIHGGHWQLPPCAGVLQSRLLEAPADVAQQLRAAAVAVGRWGGLVIERLAPHAQEAFALLWPVVQGATSEGAALAKALTALTQHPLDVLERPSLSFIVALQHLALGRVAHRRACDDGASDSEMALLLGRAGFKQIFGPLFLFGCLGRWCAYSVLVLMQIIALPAFLLYAASSVILLCDEAGQFATLDRTLRMVRAERRSGHVDAAVRPSSLAEEEERREAATLKWLDALPPAERSFDALCVICQEEEYGAEDQREIELPCGHRFHQGCVLAWFAARGDQRRCPMRCEITTAGAARNAVFH